MLQLTGITKSYQAGGLKVQALQGVTLAFERGEFVAVLGPSGCGKTTLLNIIGGLDRPDGGEMRVDGRSTKDFSERDLDAYRNHSIGFVFQTYNLISHQSVLANVEIALSLSGVGPSERRARAMRVLQQVGLSDQLTKRPNQLSGGQMQRVAIARALVNDPDILLADEPTGALDTSTSVQVLDLLKELAQDRLIIMVTHNRELAEKYATRIVELRDGRVTQDSKPARAAGVPSPDGGRGKTAMGFITAMSLSLSNLLTKRGRTLITAFAGSIGIIGIALILALSNGVSRYIRDVQKDTMSSYPIVIQEQTLQLEGMPGPMRAFREEEAGHALDAVYVNSETISSFNRFNASMTHNNLTAFKSFIDADDSPLKPYLSDVRYGYNAVFDVYAFDPEGKMVSVSGNSSPGLMGGIRDILPFSTSLLTELLPSAPDGLVSQTARDKYALLAGNWPAGAADVMLILDENNEITDMALFQMGLLPESQLQELMAPGAVETVQFDSWQYGDLVGHTFRLVTGSDYYVPNRQGLYQDLRQDPVALKAMVEQAPVLTISGIIRLEQEGSHTGGGLGYTRALTDSVVARSAASPLVAAQQAQTEYSLLTGLHFSPQSDTIKAADLRLYVSSLTQEGKLEFARQAIPFFPEGLADSLGAGLPGGEGALTAGGLSFKDLLGLAGQFAGMPPDGQENNAARPAKPGMDLFSQWQQMPGFTMETLTSMGEGQLLDLLDAFLLEADEAVIARAYDSLVAPKAISLSATLNELGLVDLATPNSISLYMDTFEDKEKISGLIEEYNRTAPEGDRIAYTDYVALMISSVTTIINVISYVLIAFVAVSLVVSSIMIGIITYISVLERTKEIGILRAVGASRRDIRRVFTAEAFIVGLAAGILGIAFSLLLTLPINAIVRRLTDDSTIRAILPPQGALILIAISALLSLLAGWLPARIAAKKDPVVALRTE